MMQTYGVAPWYGLFKWSPEDKHWVRVDRTKEFVSEDACLFWRPYKGTGKYVDPTGGAQNKIAYWCAAVHRPYDPKTDRCK
jgi:hypothetical protein